MLQYSPKSPTCFGIDSAKGMQRGFLLPLTLMVTYCVLQAPYYTSSATLQDKKLDNPLKLEGHKGKVTSLSFSPNSLSLVSGSADKTIIVWNVQTGEEKMRLIGHKGAVRTVGYSPDGKCIASGADDATVILWDAQTGKLKNRLTGHNHWVTSVAFSPDGAFWQALGQKGC